MRLLSTVAVLAAVLSVFCFGPDALGCYAVIVGREASADGSVLVGHNEQNGGRRILNFRRIPAQRFPEGNSRGEKGGSHLLCAAPKGPFRQKVPATSFEGAVVRLQRGGRLEQVPRTAGLLWSENPGMEFSDAYLNEFGVAVVSDACPTREDDYQKMVARGEIRDGGIGYMLRRLVAQRARSAREGVRLAGKLVERFGYVASGRTYVIADPREAWLMAVVCGRRWVAQRVPDDKVVVLPNIHIIGEVDLNDADHFLASPDLVDYAVRRGWFGKGGGKGGSHLLCEAPAGPFRQKVAATFSAFNFRKVYRRDRRDGADRRRWRGRQLVLGRPEPWPPKEPPPLGVVPGEKMTVAAVAAILRDTAGPGRTLSSPVTQEGAVFQLRSGSPPQIGCVYWRTSGEPSTSVLLPWYLGITRTPSNYYRPAEVSVQLSLAHHFSPPEGTFDYDGQSAWWIFKGLQDLVRADYQRRIEVVRPAWAAFEKRLFEDQPGVEQQALKLWETDQEAAQAYLTRYCAEVSKRAQNEVGRLSAALGGKK